MIEHSFLHLPGIGEQTERKLWDQGVRHWNDLEVSLNEIFGSKKASKVAEALEASRAALESGELHYFQESLRSAHAWRLIPLCCDSVAYLDIETTGLGFPPVSHSTTIAVSFRGELFVEHEHAQKRALLERLEQEAKLFVTFNGLTFDLPFLRREFGLELSKPHVDLRVWFGRHGIKGGLKRIQAGFPEVHQRSSMDIDGFDAVRLWRMHERGVPRALETLMTYNAEDSVCLEPLLHLAYGWERTRFAHLDLAQLPPMKVPAISTEVDSFVYGLLRGEESWNLPSDW